MAFTKTTLANLKKMNSPESNKKKWLNKTENGKIQSIANSIKFMDNSKVFVESFKCGMCDNPKKCPKCRVLGLLFVIYLKKFGSVGKSIEEIKHISALVQLADKEGKNSFDFVIYMLEREFADIRKKRLLKGRLASHRDMELSLKFVSLLLKYYNA